MKTISIMLSQTEFTVYSTIATDIFSLNLDTLLKCIMEKHIKYMDTHNIQQKG